MLTIHDNLIAGTCTELPLGKHLRSDSLFPVNTGSNVFVSCIPGYSLTQGDSTITCEMDSQFLYENEPICELGMS